MPRQHWTEFPDWLCNTLTQAGILLFGASVWWPVMAWGNDITFMSAWGCFPVIGMIFYVIAQVAFLCHIDDEGWA